MMRFVQHQPMGASPSYAQFLDSWKHACEECRPVGERCSQQIDYGIFKSLQKLDDFVGPRDPLCVTQGDSAGQAFEVPFGINHAELVLALRQALRNRSDNR